MTKPVISSVTRKPGKGVAEKLLDEEELDDSDELLLDCEDELLDWLDDDCELEDDSLLLELCEDELDDWLLLELELLEEELEDDSSYSTSIVT